MGKAEEVSYIPIVEQQRLPIFQCWVEPGKHLFWLLVWAFSLFILCVCCMSYIIRVYCTAVLAGVCDSVHIFWSLVWVYMFCTVHGCTVLILVTCLGLLVCSLCMCLFTL